MLKPKWIPTPLIEKRTRPRIAPVATPSRWRPLFLSIVLLRTFARLTWLRITRKASDRARAEVIRSMLEDLGGMWIKVGQLLGMRRDIFSAEFCDVLSALQDHATGFGFEHARQIIEEDLSRPIDEVFDDFERLPFAAASIGQIHRAVVRSTGVPVAVKVRRPTIARTVQGDVNFVTSLCNWVQRLHILPFMMWDDFQRELNRTLTEELDYRFEATALSDMRRNLKRHGLYAPRIFRGLSSERVLVMEFITGALMSDVLRVRSQDPERMKDWLETNNIEPQKVGRRLFNSLLRQTFEDNYFHGDLHPGNIVLLRDSRVALIDFGSVGWLEADFLAQYDRMQSALAQQQYAKAADIFLLFAPVLPAVDVEPIKTDLVLFMRGWALRARTKNIDFALKSMGYAYSEMAGILTRYRIPATWSFLRLNRAQLTLDTSLRALCPDMDYFKLMRRYSEAAARRRARKALRPQQFGAEAASVLAELPGLVRDAVERGFYDLEYVRKRARTFQSTANRVALLGALMVSFVAVFVGLAEVLLTLVFLHQWGVELPVSDRLLALLDRVPLLPPEFWWGALVVGLLLLVQFARTRRRFNRPDPDRVSGNG